MQDHLKERLTGAALLVVVVVLLVPEMFRGRPAAGGGRLTTLPEGAPLRSYEIDLRDNPPAPATVARETQAPAAAPSATAPAPGGTTAASPANASAPAEPARTEPAPVSVSAPPPAPAVAMPANRPPAAARPASPRSGWTVQVGTFSRRDYAERMVKQVRARGFAVEVAGPDDRGLFRVRSAPSADRAAALALRQKMQARGLKPIVNSTP